MVVFRALIGLVLAAVVTGQLVEITPPYAVKRIGDDLNVMCKVNYRIDSCRMTVGTTPYRLIPGNQDGDVIYNGAGLEVGECGATIRHIKEAWNGNISCVLPPPSGSIELTASMKLVVARAPADPQLIAEDQHVYKEGDLFRAKCVAANGRPAASLHWYLDDVPLDSSVLHEPELLDAPGTDLVTITQNVTIPITADLAGRSLACTAEHAGMDQPRTASRQLNVHYPPKRADSEPTLLTIFGLSLNEPGFLNVTVRANPTPDALWTVGGARVQPGGRGEAGVEALQPVALGSGYYNITLLLPQVTKEDVEREYKLNVSNYLGYELINIRISTMDEPAGVELSTGGIIGIVIAVLVLLAAITLAVFAKATDRWCFAGGRRDSKNSGESTPAGDVLIDSGIPLAVKTSDTESAGGARREGRAARGGRLAELGARVRAVLPRAKDKVASEGVPESDDKPLSEDKKGVVYAELALGEQAPGDKPPPPATEYAEIVYTDQQKQVKE